jgi:ribonucleoside-diphosphate reductase beta chain
MTEEFVEPLLDPKNARLTMFPIIHQDIWDMYKKQESAFWKAEEIDFSKDYDDFVTLSNDEQHFIKMVLAFFASSDNIVNFNLRERFTKEVKVQEALVCYDFQVMMENIHSLTYSLMLDSLVKNPEEKLKLFNAVSTVESVKEMYTWAMKWIESKDSFAHRLVAFAIVEGVFFSSSFCAIYWFKLFNNKGKAILPALCMSNAMISRDESQHTDFACLLYSKIVKKLSTDEIHSMFKEAVVIAQNFATESLPVKLIGMNSDLMKEYIEYVADRLIVTLGYSRIYNKKNPFPFMESIGLSTKGNFFETRIDSYQSAKNSTTNKTLSKLEIVEDF